MTKENEELFSILRASLWPEPEQHDNLTTIPSDIRTELQAQTVEGLTAIAYPDNGSLKYKQAARFVWMAATQTEAVRLLQEAHIPVVVLKGTASGIYYPAPYLRTYGDIDLMVPPERYLEAVAVMKDHGYTQQGDIGKSHTALWKNEFLFELHQSPPGMDEVPEGNFMLTFMKEGFNDIQMGVIEHPKCVFPMLPWKQNGLELIWHFREHLYNGIGLRHAIDWMMFVNARLHTGDEFEEFRPVLEKAGLLQLAKAVAHMCQLYLGLSESIAWCSDVDDTVCTELMEFILQQGNFGYKKYDDKASKVLTRYNTPLYFLKGMQSFGLREWKAARKHPVLRPFAWLYAGIRGIRMYIGRNGIKRLRKDYNEQKKRSKLFEKLYGKKLKNIPAPHTGKQGGISP